MQSVSGADWDLKPCTLATDLVLLTTIVHILLKYSIVHCDEWYKEKKTPIKMYIQSQISLQTVKRSLSRLLIFKHGF
jgi:hypothetical protein